MLQIRRDRDIHEEAGGWFNARWHFSFDRYRDPEQMGVGALRVFNDDRLVPGADWPMHPHRDIESLTYVVEGHFGHDDSLGNGGTLEPGAAQVMRFSSRGAMHSERNASDDEPMRFIQFWILPSEEGLESSVQQRQFTEDDRTDRWLQIMGPEGEEGLDLAQDARALVSRLTAGSSLVHRFGDDRAGYVYVIDGAATFSGTEVDTGDAGKIPSGPEDLEIEAIEDTELILIDVPLDFEPIGVWKER
ncbi:MAG: pirin family protein [Actinobacteria bacterium]|nr:pirin family protein [Actinomycetota bacterium]